MTADNDDTLPVRQQHWPSATSVTMLVLNNCVHGVATWSYASSKCWLSNFEVAEQWRHFWIYETTANAWYVELIDF